MMIYHISDRVDGDARTQFANSTCVALAAYLRGEDSTKGETKLRIEQKLSFHLCLTDDGSAGSTASPSAKRVARSRIAEDVIRFTQLPTWLPVRLRNCYNPPLRQRFAVFASSALRIPTISAFSRWAEMWHDQFGPLEKRIALAIAKAHLLSKG